MTEIPEHLLQRSRERRAAMGGDGGAAASPGGEGETTGAAAPAAAPAAPASLPAHPAPAEEPPAHPPSPMVEAHEKRRRIPIWAMPMLAALPLWAYVFAGTLEPPPSGEGPAELGAALFASNGCGACHGATGGGGVGPAFTNGAIYQTWPRFEDQVEWVRLGSTGWIDQHGDTYGATNKPVNGGMPSFGSLSDEQLVMVVYHERNTLGGPNPNPADAERLELAAELLLQNPDATLEEILAQVDSTLGTE